MFPVPTNALTSRYIIKTHYIMKVLAFYPETQTVDLIQDVFEFSNTPYGDMTVNNEFGNTVTVTVNNLDVLQGVPVKQLRWGQFEIQACPAVGDTGYIEVFTNDIQRWIEEGGPKIPWSDSHFVKKNCVFVPFIPNNVNASQDYPANEDGTADNTRLVIKSTNASITITDKPVEEGSTEEPVVDITTTAKTVNINAENGIALSGDVNLTGNLTTTGTITADGNIESTNGDIVASGISLMNHTHTLATGSVNVTGSAAAQSNPAPIIVPKPDTSATGA